LLSSTHFQHYPETWEGRAREGENGRGENGRGENERGFDEFLWESNVQLKCGTVYLLDVVG
jgi:hypothetical protein